VIVEAFFSLSGVVPERAAPGDVYVKCDGNGRYKISGGW
jgi:hypothetical protein